MKKLILAKCSSWLLILQHIPWPIIYFEKRVHMGTPTQISHPLLSEILISAIYVYAVKVDASLQESQTTRICGNFSTLSRILRNPSIQVPPEVIPVK